MTPEAFGAVMASDPAGLPIPAGILVTDEVSGGFEREKKQTPFEPVKNELTEHEQSKLPQEAKDPRSPADGKGETLETAPPKRSRKRGKRGKKPAQPKSSPP